LYRINGVANHIHILTDINPLILPIDFVRDIKVSTSIWMKSNGFFPLFKGWSVGYGSFTCSYANLDRLIEYIKNQQEHHKTVTFEEEYRNLLLENGIIPDEKYFP
jgi:REP element-mobilizing transposase RayT